MDFSQPGCLQWFLVSFIDDVDLWALTRTQLFSRVCKPVYSDRSSDMMSNTP